jgi:hypothetical protein
MFNKRYMYRRGAVHGGRLQSTESIHYSYYLAGEKQKEDKMRTPEQILETGAAWITELEVESLVSALAAANARVKVLEEALKYYRDRGDRPHIAREALEVK